MIVCIENPKESTEHFLEPIREFKKIAGYKLNIQKKKSIMFQYTTKELIDTEI